MYNMVDTTKDLLATTSSNDLPRITTTIYITNKDNLRVMSLHSKELCKHYMKSFNIYFSNDKLNPDCILVMIINPYLGTKGFTEVYVLRGDHDTALHEKAKQLLIDAVTNVMSGMKGDNTM